jgi:guanylate kinase
VLFGAGGVGKGTIARRLVASDPQLTLSRSWTTRERRPGEEEEAYVFVDRPTFEAGIEAGRFFEWAEFLGNLYGTPVTEAEPGRDLLLEIDLQGARSVRRLRPEATLILLTAPSPDVQEERLRARGDDEAHIAKRLRTGADEENEGRAIADVVVVNHDVAQTTDQVAGIVERYRLAALRGAAAARGPAGTTGATQEPRPAPDDLTEGS